MARPSFKPTDEQRKTVRAMVAYGVPLEQVASVIGIDRKTLSKHFPDEIANAAAEANAKVAQALYRQAVEQGNTTAQIFWLKTKAGWTERQEYTIEHRNVTTLSDEKLERIATGGRKRAAEATGGEDQLH